MVTGKAIIYVEKDSSAYRGFLIDPKIISCSHETGRDWIREDLEYTVPDSALKLKEGERLWVWVNYQVDYHSWYDHLSGGTEVNAEVTFNREKILKRRPPRKPLYVSKEVRLKNEALLHLSPSRPS